MGVITPAFIVLAAAAGAVSTAAGIGVRYLWKKVTKLEAQVQGSLYMLWRDNRRNV